MSSEKTIALAFLQNMWVRDPERVRALIQQYGEEYRIRFMHQALFAGCMTGRRIKAAFGNDLIRTIHFEEASREIAGDSKTICPPDPVHIRQALAAHQPKIVLTFGKIAFDAVLPLWGGRIIRIPHPAARHPSTMGKLLDAARKYEQFLRGEQ